MTSFRRVDMGFDLAVWLYYSIADDPPLITDVDDERDTGWQISPQSCAIIVQASQNIRKRRRLGVGILTIRFSHVASSLACASGYPFSS